MGLPRVTLGLCLLLGRVLAASTVTTGTVSSCVGSALRQSPLARIREGSPFLVVSARDRQGSWLDGAGPAARDGGAQTSAWPWGEPHPGEEAAPARPSAALGWWLWLGHSCPRRRQPGRGLRQDSEGPMCAPVAPSLEAAGRVHAAASEL